MAVINDVLVFVRERRARPGTTDEAAEVLEALERRLVLELEAAAGAGIGPPARAGSTTSPPERLGLRARLEARRIAPSSGSSVPGDAAAPRLAHTGAASPHRMEET